MFDAGHRVGEDWSKHLSTDNTAAMSRILASSSFGVATALLIGLTGCGGARQSPAASSESSASQDNLTGTEVNGTEVSESEEPGKGGGLGITSGTIGEGPLMELTASEIVVGEQREALPHEAKVRAIPLVRSHLPVVAGLPPREGDRIRFAKDDVLPFEFRLDRDVRGAEYVSALLSAGFEGLPLSRVEGSNVYLYVISPGRPDAPPLHARRIRWPEKALLVKLREDGVRFLRAPTASEDTAEPEEVARLDGIPSEEAISGTLQKICSPRAPCSPFAINPGPESSAAVFVDLLAAMGARAEFASTSSPPPRALLLVGEPKRIVLSLSRQRMGATAVSGRLPAETIRKIVRASFGKYRKCYEAGLGKDPTLEGKVIVRFVIDRQGKVSAVGIAPESTMPDDTVSTCIAEAYKTLEFPQPEGGIVTVTYPIMFSPE